MKRYLLTLIIATLSNITVHADDTDVYKNIGEFAPPGKLMFAIDTSGSMGCPRNNPNCTNSKMAQVRDVLNRLLINEDTKIDDTNSVGLATYNRPGASIIQPVRELDSKVTVEGNKYDYREILKREIANLQTSGSTPTLSSLFEMAMYITGGDVVFGDLRRQMDPNYVNGPRVYDPVKEVRISNPDALVPGKGTVKRDQDCINALKANPVEGHYSEACKDETLIPQGDGNSAGLQYAGVKPPSDSNTQQCGVEGTVHLILLTDGDPVGYMGTGASIGDGTKENGTTATRYGDRVFGEIINSFNLKEGTDMTTLEKKDYEETTSLCPSSLSSSNYFYLNNSPSVWTCGRMIVEKLKEFNVVTHVVGFKLNRPGLFHLANGYAIEDEDIQEYRTRTGQRTQEIKNLVNLTTKYEALETSGKKNISRYYYADNADDLYKIFTNIGNVASGGEAMTFAAPTVAVDQNNIFANSNKVYYSLFEPNSKQFWYGNPKRYHIGTYEVAGTTPKQQFSAVGNDNNSAPAVGFRYKKKTDALLSEDEENLKCNDPSKGLPDPNKEYIWGCFLDSASSAWHGNAKDGPVITIGGAAEKQKQAGSRNIFIQNVLTGDKEALSTYENDLMPLELEANEYSWLKGVDIGNKELARIHGIDQITVDPDKGINEWDQLCNLTTRKECEAAYNPTNENGKTKDDRTAVLNKTPKKLLSYPNGNRQFHGATIHGSPVVVSYRQPTETEDDSDTQVIFNSGNDGFFRAIKANNGEEIFSFFPNVLLDRVESYASGTSKNEKLLYGLDSQWVPFIYDGAGNTQDPNNNLPDGDILDTGDFARLYGGMRRGGRSFFGFDVQNTFSGPAAAPFDVLFEHRGGEDGEFKCMGQTWSIPKVLAIRTGTDKRVPAVIFGGGYDERYDSEFVSSDGKAADETGCNVLGNQLYILDYDGKVLWWATGKNEGGSGSDTDNPNNNDLPTSAANVKGVVVDAMKHSITGSVKALDLNNDGLIDFLYFADLGGQIFRMNFNNINDDTTIANRISIDLVASLADTSAAADARRRFYSTPSVAAVRETENLDRYVAIAVTSGWRASPSSTAVDDRFFIIKDREPFNWNPDSETRNTVAVTLSDLTDIDGNNTDDTGSDDERPEVGWYMDFPNIGEKGFGKPVIVENMVFFTSYTPPPADSQSPVGCGFTPGTSLIYGLNLFDGKGVFNNRGEVVDEGTTRTTDAPLGTADMGVALPTIDEISKGNATYKIFGGPKSFAGPSIPEPLQKVRWKRMNQGLQVDFGEAAATP